MKFFLLFVTARYETDELKQFDDLNALIEFVNARADNPDFRFRVIEGREIQLKPVSIVTKYVRD